jgi:hypothetical protein
MRPTYPRPSRSLFSACPSSALYRSQRCFSQKGQEITLVIVLVYVLSLESLELARTDMRICRPNVGNKWLALGSHGGSLILSCLGIVNGFAVKNALDNR